MTGLRFGQKVEFRTIYVYRGDPNAIQESAFLIGFLSQSQDQKFETSNGLTIIADKQNIALGSARRLSRRVPDGVQELLLYKIGAISLKQIANAKKLTVRLGRYSGPMAGDVQDSIRQLIEMSL